MSSAGQSHDLESLRSQVAHLTRELAERDRTLYDLRNIMDTLPNFIFTLDTEGGLMTGNRRMADVTGFTPEELHRSKARLTYILENNPSVVYTRQVGNRWPITFITPNVYELLGYTSVDIIGDPDRLDGLIHPDDDRDIMKTGMPHLLSDGAYTFVYRLRHRDSTYRWIEDRARLTDYEGGPLQVVGTMLDITDRKHAEEALSRREQELRTMLQERERISQDLHDGILQSLYAVGLGLESSKLLMRQQKYRKASELLEQAIGQTNRVMGEIRNFIAGLDSGILSGDTISSALQTVIRTVTATQPLQCAVTIDDAAASRLSAEQALHVMNIVREALSNSLRHGQATKAMVSLTQLAHSARLCISDNGQGFNPSSMQGVGRGLANMAARACKIGGRYAVRSAPQRGTRIIVDLPQKEAYANVEITSGPVTARRRS